MRIKLVLLSGNHPTNSVSGVGDQERLLTLADSVVQRRGLSYFNQPTALRPPLYPLILAAFHVIFGAHYLLAIRVFQFLLGTSVAFICALIGKHLFGNAAGAAAGAIALALPTLVFISTEIQTEQLATFLAALFLFFLVGEIQGNTNCALGMGISSGLATLTRFNCVIFVVIGVTLCLWSRRRLRDALIVCSVAGLIIAPWIVRNAIEFRGRILFSSHGGINLLEGALTPYGRAQHGEDEVTRAAVGWIHTDIEVNSPHRALFPDETELDKQAQRAAIAAWKNLSWKSRFILFSKKTCTFWLSTDQLLDTSSFSPTQRRLRAAGVIIYWIVLATAFFGWVGLYSSSRNAAVVISLYAIFVTLAHLPFVMNTRIRIPFVDPLISILAAGGLIAFLHRGALRSEHTFRKRARPVATALADD